MRASLALIAFTFLLAMCLDSAPAASHSEASSAAERLHGDSAAGAVPYAIHRFTYLLRTEGLAEVIAEEGRYEVRLQQDLTVPLEMSEFDMFLPGQKKAAILDAEGHAVREWPIQARTFHGHNAETGERAFLVVAPEGLYGSVRHRGIEYSLQPREWHADVVSQEAAWDLPETLPEASLPTLSRQVRSSIHAEDSGFSPTPTTVSGYYLLVVAPYAEPSWTAVQPDWWNWIVNAYGYAIHMWRGETNIDIGLMSPRQTAGDYAGIAACNGLWDNGLANFEWYWVRNNVEAGVNAYGLFHGKDGRGDEFGCAHVRCDTAQLGCLQHHQGPTNYEAAHAIQARDVSSTDNYDATRSDHVGKAIAHELSHNAGENSHPGVGYCWWSTQHLMGLGIPMGCRGTFRLSETINEVKSYSHPRLSYG